MYIDLYNLVVGIIMIIIGCILYYFSPRFPPVAKTIGAIIGVILVVLGIIVAILAVLLPGVI